MKKSSFYLAGLLTILTAGSYCGADQYRYHPSQRDDRPSLNSYRDDSIQPYYRGNTVTQPYYYQDSQNSPNRGYYYQESARPRDNFYYQNNPNLPYNETQEGYQSNQPSYNSGNYNYSAEADSSTFHSPSSTNIYTTPSYHTDSSRTDSYSTPSYNTDSSRSTSIFGDTRNQARPSDHELTKKIQDSLRGTAFSKGYKSVNVQVTNGVVSLTGNVDTEQERQDVKSKVQGINGVRSINDQLDVRNRTTTTSSSSYSY